VLPALNAQIVAVTGGYEIVEWAGGDDSSDPGLLAIWAAPTGDNGPLVFFGNLTTSGNQTLTPGQITDLQAFGNGTLTVGRRSGTTVTIAANATLNIDSPYNSTIFQPVGGAGGVGVSGGGVVTFTANATYTGTTMISAGALVLTYPNLPTGGIFVQGTGVFEYQPDANDSLVINAGQADGREYVWGNTTYEAYVIYEIHPGGIGTWVLPTLGIQIIPVAGGYEILPWVAPDNQNTTTADGIWHPVDPAQTPDVMDPQIALYARELAVTDPQTALEWAATISDGWMRDHIMADISSQIAAAGS
jgi:autotransporter-associated beta strand protein